MSRANARALLADRGAVTFTWDYLCVQLRYIGATVLRVRDNTVGQFGE
jgi:hypothetical protein